MSIWSHVQSSFHMCIAEGSLNHHHYSAKFNFAGKLILIHDYYPINK